MILYSGRLSVILSCNIPSPEEVGAGWLLTTLSGSHCVWGLTTDNTLRRDRPL